MVEYFEELKRAAKDSFANPILLLPYVLQSVAMMILGLLLLLVGAVIILPMGGLSLTGLFNGTSSFAWQHVFLMPIIIFSLLFFFLLLFLNTWFSAGILGMLNTVADGQPASGFFTTARERFKELLLFNLFRVACILLFLLPLTLFILLAIFNQGMRIFSIIFAVLTGMLFIALAVFLSIIFLFTPQMIIRKKLGAWEAIVSSYHLLKERPGHVFSTWGVTLLFGLVVGLAIAIIIIPFSLLGDLVHPAFSFVSTLLRILLQWLIAIVSTLYLFMMYKAVEPTTARRTS